MLDVAQTIIPDGRSELVINLSQPFQDYGYGLNTPSLTAFSLVKSSVHFYFALQAQPESSVSGFILMERGDLTLPMFELTDSVVSVDDIPASLNRELEQIRGLRSLPEQIGRLDLIMRAHHARSSW